MATLDITQFFSPLPPDNEIKPGDLIHLGRPTNASGEKDIALTGTELFNSLNRLGYLTGAPTGPTSIGAGATLPIIGYQNGGAGLGSPNAAAGTFTVAASGLYRVNANVVFSTTTRDMNLAFVFQNTTKPDVIVDGRWFVNQGGDVAQFSVNNLASLTTGDVINMALSADSATTISSYTNATFDISPITL